MPWKEVEPMQEKERFVHLARSGRFTISELCLDFGISRKTGHKYLKRYSEHGRSGLVERSRKPLDCEHTTKRDVIGKILHERRKRPTWGPKKLREVLFDTYGIEHPPACSTIAEILKRNGLSQRRKRNPGVYRVHPESLIPKSVINTE